MIFWGLGALTATYWRTHKGELTSCELENIWLAERESSSDDSSESSRVILLRLGMLLESWVSSRGSRSLRSRLSMERLRTPQLKLSTVSPCNRELPWVKKYQDVKCNLFSNTNTHTTMQCRFREQEVSQTTFSPYGARYNKGVSQRWRWNWQESLGLKKPWYCQTSPLNLTVSCLKSRVTFQLDMTLEMSANFHIPPKLHVNRSNKGDSPLWLYLPQKAKALTWLVLSLLLTYKTVFVVTDVTSLMLIEIFIAWSYQTVNCAQGKYIQKN